jgi:hypothetical protein
MFSNFVILSAAKDPYTLNLAPLFQTFLRVIISVRNLESILTI